MDGEQTVAPPLPPLPQPGGPRPGRSAAREMARRCRAWAPVCKAGLLFVLPLPLVAAVLAALVVGDPGRLALVLTALAAYWTAGAFSWRALAAEARYALGERTDLPAAPLKLLSMVLTAVGAACAATAGGHGPAGVSMFAALAGGGYLAFYGRDRRPAPVRIAPMPGVNVASVTEQIEQAYQRLRRIEAASRAVLVPEFADRLQRIIGIGRGILAEIERDPRHASRMRRFLNLYLDSTERVTDAYARTHRQVSNRALEQNFRQLLIDMEQMFAQQHRKLLENDALSLDVEIEVLNARLKREGAGAFLETRS